MISTWPSGFTRISRPDNEALQAEIRGFESRDEPNTKNITVPVLPLVFVIAHDEVNVHCSPAKKVFFHNSQLHNERLLDKSQNP